MDDQGALHGRRMLLTRKEWWKLDLTLSLKKVKVEVGEYWVVEEKEERDSVAFCYRQRCCCRCCCLNDVGYCCGLCWWW